MEGNEEIGAIQDGISYRRIAAYELRRLSEQVELLERQAATRQRGQFSGWMIPVLFGVLLTGAIGYIGIVHQMVYRYANKMDVLSEEQYRQSSARADIDDLKKRIRENEGGVQQIPFLAKQISDVNMKIDRLLERIQQR